MARVDWMKIEKYLFILALFLFAVIFFSSFVGKNLNKMEEESTIFSTNFTKVEVDTKGFIETKVSVDSIFLDKAQISLRAGCYLIKATTDACVGEAILKGIERKVDFRPSVYDVIADTFRSLGIEVLALKIVEMRNNTFIGQLVVQQNNKVLFLDIRPSDGTAIAVRFNSPIYINESLAKEVGEYVC
ncbi:MAG: DUF151 domain-containing protein [Candidatus Aenigmatarchaeota archaeon]